MDSNNTNLKKCSYCSEDIPAGAGRCPFCGSLLEVVVDADPYKTPQEQNKDNAGLEQQAPIPAEIPASAPSTTGTGDVNSRPSYSSTNTPGGQGPYYNNPYGYREYKRQPLGNGLKVFLTILFTLIPGIGQLAGIITAIVFMNTDDDPDRKSFGVAILVASLIMFVIACIGCFIFAASYSAFQTGIQNFNF